MKVTYNWLKDFVDIKIPAQELADKLTMAGLEVVSLQKTGGDFILELEITSPDNPRKAIMGVGEVLWTRPAGTIRGSKDVNVFDTGVKFVNVNPVSLGRVYSYYNETQKA